MRYFPSSENSLGARPRGEGSFPRAASLRLWAVIGMGASLLLFCAPASARKKASSYRLEIMYQSSHGCSQSFASTSFSGHISLTISGSAATLSMQGRHHYSMGPSLGRFRASGGRDKTHHTFSTIDLRWTGTARKTRAGVEISLPNIQRACKTTSGYYSTTAFACNNPSSMTLSCKPDRVPVYPAVKHAGSGAYTKSSEKSTDERVLRCVPRSSDLGLLGYMLYKSALPLSKGRTIVHHFHRFAYPPYSVLRLGRSQAGLPKKAGR